MLIIKMPKSPAVRSIIDHTQQQERVHCKSETIRTVELVSSEKCYGYWPAAVSFNTYLVIINGNIHNQICLSKKGINKIKLKHTWIHICSIHFLFGIWGEIAWSCSGIDIVRGTPQSLDGWNINISRHHQKNLIRHFYILQLKFGIQILPHNCQNSNTINYSTHVMKWRTMRFSL